MSEVKAIASNLPVPEDSPALTLEQLKAVMPVRQKQNITQDLVDSLNQMMVEPEYREHFRDNLLSYADVLQDPNTTMKGYIRAVKYVSYKLMGYTNQEAWVKTFPERYQIPPRSRAPSSRPGKADCRAASRRDLPDPLHDHRPR